MENNRPDAKRSPGRPAIPLERIFLTALNIVADSGPEALTMRALAERLGSGTATLYRHFPSRADLIGGMVDWMLGRAGADHDGFRGMGWAQACEAGAHRTFAAIARHPNLAALLVENVPTGPNAMAQRERSLAMLLDNGFDPLLAAYAHATLSRYVLGFAAQIRGSSAAGGGDDARLASAFANLDPAHFPATRRVAKLLPVPLEQEFAFGLELILNGLAARLEANNRQRDARTPRSRKGGGPETGSSAAAAGPLSGRKSVPSPSGRPRRTKAKR